MDFAETVNDLKTKAARFTEIYRDFVNVEPVAKQSPTLYSKWQSVKSTVDLVKSQVSWVTSAIDTASGWINSIGLNGLNSLSAIPLIPIAAIVAAAAALVYATNQMLGVLSDVYEFKKRQDIVSATNADRKASGLPPLSANEVNAILNKPGGLGTWAVIALIGLAAYYAAPKILAGVKGLRK